MKLSVYFVDTFTNTPFKGNPTSVCLADTLPGKAAMQAIAAELNLPVTAFICRQEDHYDIKYYTPVTEIPACGHATLGSARIAIVEDNTSAARFKTSKGLMIDTHSKQDHILMRYPKYEWKENTVDAETLASLSITSYGPVAFSPELETLFIELDSPDELRNIQPDFRRMEKSTDLVKEIVITSASDDPRFDYLLRSFCPWIGIDEDPVTGSVHSVLGPYWQRRLNKTELRAFQASARGGEILVNALNGNIEIGGQSVIIMKGEMNY